jgi:hypothetical protein
VNIRICIIALGEIGLLATCVRIQESMLLCTISMLKQYKMWSKRIVG